MKSHRILPAALLLCTLAACGQTPTGSAPHAQPAGASYDGGYTIGSGGKSSEESGGYTIGSGNTQNTGTTSGEDAERGGYTIGSGG